MPASLRDLGGERVERLAYRRGHFLIAARIHHHIGDAAHQVLAEADLRVHQARRGDDIAIGEIGEMHGDRRRADIDGKSEGLVVEAGPQRDEAIAFAAGARIDGGGDLPFALAQRSFADRE